MIVGWKTKWMDGWMDRGGREGGSIDFPTVVPNGFKNGPTLIIFIFVCFGEYLFNVIDLIDM